MCNHCTFHRARASHHRFLAETAGPSDRAELLQLADVHERRIAEYEAIHGKVVPLEDALD